MYRLKYPINKSLAHRIGQVNPARITRPLAAALIIFAFVVLPVLAIEYEPGEREAEIRFEMGIGEPWIISEEHPELYGGVEHEDIASYLDSQFAQFREYFSMGALGGPAVERYYASVVPENYAGGTIGQLLASSAYQLASSGANALWILGAGSSTGYALVPEGAYLRLLAYAPAGGVATFYDIKPDYRMDQTQYNLYPGYNQVLYQADLVGRTVLLFSAGGRLSNSVILDVKSWSGPLTSPVAVTEPPGYGYAKLTLTSATLKGYSVWIDGSYVGADGSSGDILDGVFSVYVYGNQRHTVKVYGSGKTCTSSDYYENGQNYTIDLVC